ncbi:MAG TPA: hypothetical protein EYQ50_00530 [Verrucomicrobiales bacterium]|nr:hypothetical protein [Verrucomicrobiales bacterium]HIL68880.1 hypothetical protein [Verrucomicrobiota bacterium]
MQLYPLSGREIEWERRISRARANLSKAKPISFNQQVFQLLGMGWADENPDQLSPFVTAIIEKQQANGGWSQLEGLPSDSRATGQAFVALNTVGGVDVADTVYQKGVRFLLRTQYDEGSWFVRSRAWPFQPHFESGFPHGKDQWISAGGTTWAVMALLLTQPKIESVTPVNWMSISFPDEPKESTPAVSARTDWLKGVPRIDFTRDIQPLLERSCAACHGAQAKRKKGKFNITTREHFMKGGQSGVPAVLVGNGNASAIIKMVTDQLEDLEMPPLSKRKNFPPLTLNEVALLKSWIDAGLPW